MDQRYFDLTPEVKEALASNKPILALESTLITHGLDYPHNLNIALEVEAITRVYNVVPATIAILNGRVKIGLSQAELNQLILEKNIHKASTRDLPYLLSHGLTAGTTVAATMYCAHRASIKVFATGGIGGVHRGNELDISADLLELARTEVAVVCAGAKAILDIAKTLEYLETHGVPVIGYQTNNLPAFYSASSEHQLTINIENLTALAKLVSTHFDLNIGTGIVIANPIPHAMQIPSEDIEPVIQQALANATRDKICGKSMTPYLLKQVAMATEGRSVQANLALIRNNVRLGAELALELASLSNMTPKDLSIPDLYNFRNQKYCG